MVKSMFSGIAGLRAHQAKMDVIGNNIANVNTYGYKAGRVTFKESVYQTTASSSGGSATYGGTNPSQIGYGSQVGTIDLMFASGNYSPTDSSTDCMIDGEGFFLVGPKMADIEVDEDDPAATHAALSGLSLTRVGNFEFDGDGYLVDGAGNVVYGFTADGEDNAIDTSVLKPIRTPLDDNGDPIKLSSISVAKTGEITGNDDDGKSVLVGVIAVANVPNPSALEKTQGPYFMARENTGYVVPFAPGEGTTGLLEAYGLEMSNVDLAKEFSDMITTQRGFQANTRIITVTDEMLQELVNIKR